MTDPQTTPERFVSGFVSILGLPNVGKSTLLNALIETKLAIVSDKPQTTRTSIQGVLHLPGAQVTFLDTPGIHRPDTPINKRMMHSVTEALEGRDLLLYLHDATNSIGERDLQAIALLEPVKTPTLLVLNKIDRIRDKPRLLPLLEQFQAMGRFDEFLPISALTGDGLDDLLAAIVKRLPEGPKYFPDDYLTDQPERFLVAEMIREKILRLTREEVPHSVMVEIEQWEEAGNLIRVSAAIFVERKGQKAILIGRRGEMLKQVGTEARQELETLLDRKLFLEMFVKVREKWRDNPAFLASIDWRR